MVSPCTKVFVDPRDLPVRISTSWAPRSSAYARGVIIASEQSGMGFRQILHTRRADFISFQQGFVSTLWVVRSSFTEGSNLRCERHRNRRAAISKTTLRILYVFVVLEVGTGGFCIGT
jgi:hypothetical protein